MYVLGIDVGTTGTKALLLDGAGRVTGQGYRGYETARRSGGIVEQDPLDWWEAVKAAVGQAIGKTDSAQVAGLCLSTQGGSSLLADGRGNPLCAAITWMDLRSLPQKEALDRTLGSQAFYRKTGWPLNPSLDACKALWLAEERPQLLDGAEKYVSTLEFIQHRMTGRWVIDPTNAAMRQMMNLDTRDWDGEILEQVQMDRRLLPEIRPSGDCIGTLTREAAEALGLHTGVKVYNGAHDQYCCGLGSGSIHQGDTYLGTGTAWALMHNTHAPLFTDSMLSPGPHVLPGMWAALSSVSCGGMALDWVRSRVIQADYRSIDEQAARRMGKGRGILFYPTFAGAGCPQWDSGIRGSVVGLELHHDGYDLALGAMEGVAFQTAALLGEYRRSGAVIDRLRVMGGGGRSGPWMEILAACGGCEIDRVKVSDAAPLGAAMIAAVRGGLFASYDEAVGRMVDCEALPPPTKELREYYQEKMKHYFEAWPQVSSLYHKEVAV